MELAMCDTALQAKVRTATEEQDKNLCQSPNCLCGNHERKVFTPTCESCETPDKPTKYINVYEGWLCEDCEIF